MNLLGHSSLLRNLRYYKLKKRIKINEGYSFRSYKDRLGFSTIGYGHLILTKEKKLLYKKLNKKEIEKLFQKDFNKSLKNFENFLKKFSSNKKDDELLIEMVYQIGIKGVLKFKNLLYNMKKGNSYLVCFEMMSSLWYKQTPVRVKKLINIFLKNE